MPPVLIENAMRGAIDSDRSPAIRHWTGALVGAIIGLLVGIVVDAAVWLYAFASALNGNSPI